MIDNNPAPSVPKALEYYLKAYFSLCSERLNTISAIPVTRMYRYCDYVGIEDADEFVGILESMDVEYITQMSKIQQQQTNNPQLESKNRMLAERAKAHGLK